MTFATRREIDKIVTNTDNGSNMEVEGTVTTQQTTSRHQPQGQKTITSSDVSTHRQI